MTRSSRSKTRSTKVNTMTDGIRTTRDSSEDLNGIGIDNTSPERADLTKKRGARTSSSSDSNHTDGGPPSKKRHVTEDTRGTKNTQKRHAEVNNDEKPTKLARHEQTSQRIWSQIEMTDKAQSNSNVEPNNAHDNFVIVFYNIKLVSSLFQKLKHTNDKRDCYLQHDLLMSELTFINADIVCLQYIGVDHWLVLEKSLKENGYAGNIIPGDINQFEGIAILYRVSRFEQIAIDSDRLSKLCCQHLAQNNGFNDNAMKSIKQYIDEPENYMVTILKDKQQERLLIVGNARLSSDKSDKPDLKCIQATSLFWRIHDMNCQITQDYTNNNNIHYDKRASPCWILCGDFNSYMDSPVYQICRDGYPDDTSIEKLQAVKNITVGDNSQSSSLVDLLWKGFQHPIDDSCNSYKDITCHSANKDYIWMSKSALQTHKVLTVCNSTTTTNSNNNTHNALSNQYMSLACDLAFIT